MDPLILAAWGLPGLFVAAFLAGSVLPFPSEAVLIALLGGGLQVAPVVLVATAGNLLGAATLFWAGGALGRGRFGRFGAFVQRGIERDPAAFERAQRRLRRWGTPLLLFTWLPLVGDLFAIAAGFIGMRALPFVLVTAAGKLARFAAVAAAATALGG